MFEIRNFATGQVYAEVPTLTAARNFCQQRLLRSSASREGFLFNLAACYIEVYDASATCYRDAGF